MRALLLALLAVVVGGAAGCDRAPPARAAAWPWASFETRCAGLPPAQVEVVAVPSAPRTDESRSLDALTGMYDRAAPHHRTLGLTEARFGRNAALEFDGLADAAGRRACFRAHMRVELTLAPMTVYIAREVAADPCRRAAVAEHEQKHVAVYEAFLDEAAARLARELPAAFPDRVHQAADAGAGQREVQQAVAAYLEEFAQAGARELDARQAEVDSPEEYARVEQACADASAPAGR